MVWKLTTPIVVIIMQYLYKSSHYVLYLKPIQCYMSILTKPVEGGELHCRRAEENIQLSLVIGNEILQHKIQNKTLKHKNEIMIDP